MLFITVCTKLMCRFSLDLFLCSSFTKTGLALKQLFVSFSTALTFIRKRTALKSLSVMPTLFDTLSAGECYQEVCWVLSIIALLKPIVASLGCHRIAVSRVLTFCGTGNNMSAFFVNYLINFSAKSFTKKFLCFHFVFQHLILVCLIKLDFRPMQGHAQWGLCAYIIVHTILPPSPVILWIEQGGKPKWLPLNIGYHDVMRTAPIVGQYFAIDEENHS